MKKTLAVMHAIAARDLLIAGRNPGDIIAGAGYFVVIITLLPLAVGSDAALLGRIAPAMLWIAAFISALPQMERFFGGGAAGAAGSAADDLILAPIPLWLAVLAKAAGGWVIIAAPLVVLTPLLAAMLGLPAAAWPLLTLGLACGSIALVLLGMLAGAITIGARRGALLIALLVLPLAMPVLIFGASAADAAARGEAGWPQLALLAAATLILLAVVPPAAAMGIKLAAEG